MEEGGRMAKKQLSTQEKLKIINADVELWLENFVKITNAKNELIPFKINAVQRDFLRNKGKYNIILKSRQLGFSTLSLGIMLYNAYQRPNTTYLVVAHNRSSLRELFNRLKSMQNSIPKQYRLKENKNNREELELENGSRIIVQNPSQGLGAGMTLEMVLLSEYALYSDLHQEESLTTVEPALAKNKDSLIIIESTAKGVQNNHYQLWQSAEKGRSRWKPFFYGWTSKSHLDLFRYEIDIAVDWYKSGNKGRPLTSDPLELDPYERMLLEKTNVTLLALMWRRWKLAGSQGDKFLEHYPAFPNEAFVSTNVGVFDASTILERMYHVPKPLKNIKGLPKSLEKFIGKGLNIYQEPRPGMYFIGADVSAGLKLDYSTLSVLDQDGEQVATFARNDLASYRFVDVVVALGHYYNYGMVLVERNSYGLDVLNRLVREKRYINVLKTKKFDKITGRRRWEHGWYNDSVSKTKLVNDGREAFETGMVLLNCQETLEQMQIYTDNRGSFGNKKGDKNHDDLVDAFLLSVQAWKIGRYYI